MFSALCSWRSSASIAAIIIRTNLRLSMTLPLVVLAVLSLGGGFLNVPHWLEPMFPEKAEHGNESLIVYLPLRPACSASLLAYLFYVAKPGLADSFANGLGGLYKLVYNKYFVDEVYDAAVVKPLMQGSRTVLWRGMDAGLIDGIVNGVGRRRAAVGNILKLLQSGSIRNYAAWVVFGSHHRDHRDRPLREARDEPAEPRHLDPAARLPHRLDLLPKDKIQAIRVFALGISLLTFVASLGLIGPLLVCQPEWLHVSRRTCLGSIRRRIHYHVGLDGLSLWLVILTTLLDAALRADLVALHR